MNNLYIQTAFLGDLLLAVPTLKQIRYWDPKASLTVVCRKGLGSLLKELGLCDEIIEMDKANKSEAFDQLKNRKFKNIFCPHQSMTSHKLVRSLKAEAKIGYQKLWNSSYFTHRVNRRLEWPEAIRQLQLLGATSEAIALKLEAFEQKPGDIPTWAQMSLPNLSWTDKEIGALADKKAPGFKFDQPYICIAPGSVWPTKRWTPEKFINVSVSLVRLGYQIIILGAPEERDLCDRMKGDIPNSYSLAGNMSIVESIMILSRAKGLICNDSGAMHMASLLALPCVAIFGPTVQELGYKPWNPRAIVVENEQLLCRPCGQHGARNCPIGTHDCMTSVDEKNLLKQASALFR